MKRFLVLSNFLALPIAAPLDNRMLKAPFAMLSVFFMLKAAN